MSALSLMLAFALIIKKSWLLSPQNEEFSGLMIALCVLVLFVSFLGDQIFRKFISTLGKLWVMQLALIVFTLVVILILKISVFN